MKVYINISFGIIYLFIPILTFYVKEIGIKELFDDPIAIFVTNASVVLPLYLIVALVHVFSLYINFLDKGTKGLNPQVYD